MNNYFKEIKMERIDNDAARLFMSRHHYTHTCPKPVLAYGVYHNGKMQCCVVYGRPVGKNLSSSIWEGGNDNECLELVRLFSYDECPKNIESWSISNSIKMIRRDMPQIKVLVSYADTGAGHIGYIYQASSWQYIGIGSSEHKIFIDGERQHRRTLYSRYGTSSLIELKDMLGDRLVVEEDRFTKNKYIKIINDKKNVEKLLKVDFLPYPKGDIKYYTESSGEFDCNGKNKLNKIKKNYSLFEGML